MSKTIIAEGRTTNEAIENGLKELKVSRDLVNIKVLESDDKRSFFSILAPRVVKVEMTLKENVENKTVTPSVPKEKKEIVVTPENQQKAKENVEKFLENFVKTLPEGTKYTVETVESGLNISLNHEKLGYLIGYRGETLYALQNVLASIATKGIEQKIRVILDIEGYKAKREKTLEDLAEKVAKTVVKTRKSVTLEPMQPYERKIIHSKLQENPRVETVSIGEEPRRRVVISLKK